MVFLAKETPIEMETDVAPPTDRPKLPPPASAVMSDVSLALMVVNPLLAMIVLPST